MPTTTHVERHFTASDMVRDIVIGMSDGLTVPFALAAGLTGVSSATTAIVVTAGLAEIAAGSIAMGLGGYLAARTEAEHYRAEREREIRETHEKPVAEAQEVAEIFSGYGMPPAQVKAVVDAIRGNRDRWVDFMMRYELGLEAPEPARAAQSAVAIALSYVAGGLIPLAPYMVVSEVSLGLRISVGLTLAALFVFGYLKGKATETSPLRSGAHTVLVGGLAAAAAFLIAKRFS